MAAVERAIYEESIPPIDGEVNERITDCAEICNGEVLVAECTKSGDTCFLYRNLA